ncbi:MAG TPA: hypothetical protein VF746_06400 [Longimicrobium sp.]
MEAVEPVLIRGVTQVRTSHRAVWFENERNLHKAADDLRKALEGLAELGFKGREREPPPCSKKLLDAAWDLVRDGIYAGETLLVYHKRLVDSSAAYGFLHQNSVVQYWDGYEMKRRCYEINQFVTDAEELLTGYAALGSDDERFILDNIDLPSELEADFLLARNLFSVGFDDVALLIAGRGLEGVLRKIAEVRKLSISVKGKSSPAHEADFYDLIELVYRVQWKKKKQRLIGTDTKSLLHYLRTLRNSGAHASASGRNPSIRPRETALLVAETANQLWHEVTGTRARLEPTTVDRTW